MYIKWIMCENVNVLAKFSTEVENVFYSRSLRNVRRCSHATSQEEQNTEDFLHSVHQAMVRPILLKVLC